MKALLFAAVLAAAAGGGALAQSAPPTPNAMMRARMETIHTQMMQMHKQMRAQILNALTPAHRQLLATIAGQLATSANPDYKAAAARMDAALSAKEKQAVIAAANAMHTRMRSMMQNMMPPPGAPPMGVMRKRDMDGKRTPDAGRIVIDMAVGHMPEHGMMMMRVHP